MGMRASISYSVKDNTKGGTVFDPVADMDGKWTLENLLLFTKNALLTVSEDVLKDEQSRGFDKKPVVIVDNKYNRSVNEVSPLGKIEFVARQSYKELILFAYDEVLKKSPIGGAKSGDQGKYIDHNVVVFNGFEVARNMEGLKRWLNSNPTISDRDIIRIVNTQPYARKLERLGIMRGREGTGGKQKYAKGKGGVKVKVPNGAYTLAYRALKHKYKGNAVIKLDVRLTGDKMGLVGPGRTFVHGRGKGRPYLYPSIVIRLFNSGITDGGGMLQ